MKMEITPRDRNLLIFLAVFVIVVGFGYWGIRPLIKSIGETRLEIEEQQDLKQVNDMKISMLPMLLGENKQLEEDMLTVREHFYPMMEADEIDRHFTGMALDYRLNVYSLDIYVADSEVESEPYKYSEKREEEGLHTEEGYVEEEGTTTDIESVDTYAETGYTDLYEDEVKPATGIYTATVDMRLEGAREDLQRLLDDLSGSDENHLLKSYNWSQSSSMAKNEKGDYIVDEKVFLDLELDIYEARE